MEADPNWPFEVEAVHHFFLNLLLQPVRGLFQPCQQKEGIFLADFFTIEEGSQVFEVLPNERGPSYAWDHE